jgi:hypothetical protein
VGEGRVSRARLQGDSDATCTSPENRQHSDPGRYQIVLTDGDIRSIEADGVSRDIHLSTGASAWTEPMTHTAENIGSTTYEQIDIIPDK